ncbi:hypothetical protein GOEFS_046_00350 [Gordonia effusa NBRC 100432]|uniref:Uncharacterized protein n=1 Tax=Gordonia effusa NBRC 100432 TaxID=1077974 RepID=H0QZ28_9ACTN|nr:DUF6297 family protein [Gordonia effusa]GAB18079.1 hypothetical protein GOEFS_046_00350 [Gordonia effusa NBRC 100432]
MSGEDRYLLGLSLTYLVFYYGGVVRPSVLGRVVSLDVAGTGAAVVVLAAAGLLAACGVGYALRLWGPVRIDRATARWRASGPSPRSPLIRTALSRAVAAAVLSMATIAGALVAVAPDRWPVVVVACALGTVGAIAIPIGAQSVRSMRRRGIAVWNRRSLAEAAIPSRLHRAEIAPADGLVASLTLGASTMDTTWFGGARTQLWSARHAIARSRRLTGGVLGAATAGWSTLAAADVTRLGRHPAALLRWAGWIGVGVLTGTSFTFAAGGSLIVAVAAYCAGLAVSDGLCRLAESSALRCALGRSDRFLTSAHAVVPATAVAIASVIVGSAWSVSWLGVAVLTIGVTGAVLRRATRPPVIYDGVLVIDPFFGLSFSPGMARQLIRGPVALVLTSAVLAMT